jgi:hypothetical protein
MAGGELRLGTASMYMAHDICIRRNVQATICIFTWLHFCTCATAFLAKSIA